MSEPELTDCQILCLRYIDLHSCYTLDDEEWPELDVLASRGFLKNEALPNGGRVYDTTLAGNKAAKEALRVKQGLKPVSLADAATSLAKQLRDDRRVVSIGVRAASIAIMVDHTKRPLFVFEEDPWQGWPVEVVNHGPMAVMGGGPDA